MPSILNLKFKVGRPCAAPFFSDSLFPFFLIFFSCSFWLCFYSRRSGKQVFCRVQQSQWYRVFDEDMEGGAFLLVFLWEFSRLFLAFRSVPRSPVTSNKARDSRTWAGGYGTFRILWLIPTMQNLNVNSRNYPNAWVISWTRRKDGSLLSACLLPLPPPLFFNLVSF